MFSLPEKSGWKPAPNSSSDVSFPIVSILPLFGYMIFVSSFSSVDFPLPFVPINATTSPFFIFALTPFSTSLFCFLFLEKMNNSFSLIVFALSKYTLNVL